MPSPFPGMDPYLENPDLWPGFRASLITELQSQLSPLLRPDYFVRPMIAEPARNVESFAENTREMWLEIRQPADRALVGVIEVLSPASKIEGSGAQRRFLQRHREAVESGAHRMEIDLLLAGTRTPALHPDFDSAYRVLLIRGGERGRTQLFPIQLRQKLPPVGLPLRMLHADAPMDFQLALERVYERGGYDLHVDYSEDPKPPVSSTDLQWIREQIRNWKRRMD